MMSLVQDRLGRDFSSKIAFASITVDPEHDTPEMLKLYAQAYGADVRWRSEIGWRQARRGRCSQGVGGADERRLRCARCLPAEDHTRRLCADDDPVVFDV